MALPERTKSGPGLGYSRAWKARCVMAWACRVCGLASAILSMLGLSYWYTLDPGGFDHVVALGPAGIAVISFGAFGFWELLGRLLSWTSPWKPLPRFQDRRDDARRDGGGHPGAN